MQHVQEGARGFFHRHGAYHRFIVTGEHGAELSQDRDIQPRNPPKTQNLSVNIPCFFRVLPWPFIFFNDDIP
jgi:hypothetical protein